MFSLFGLKENIWKIRNIYILEELVELYKNIYVSNFSNIFFQTKKWKISFFSFIEWLYNFHVFLGKICKNDSFPKDFVQYNIRKINSPRFPLSYGENPNSLAISVAELFNKQPTAFYFEMDSSSHQSTLWTE